MVKRLLSALNLGRQGIMFNRNQTVDIVGLLWNHLYCHVVPSFQPPSWNWLAAPQATFFHLLPYIIVSLNVMENLYCAAQNQRHFIGVGSQFVSGLVEDLENILKHRRPKNFF